MTRSEVLSAAEKTVCTDRNVTYGAPEDNFKVIGDLWSTYLKNKVPALRNDVESDFLTPEMVADMMVLFKVGRNVTATTPKADTYIDIAGYAACGCEIATEKKALFLEKKMNVPIVGGTDKVCEEKPLTRKEVISKLYPNKVGSRYYCGVSGCPPDYDGVSFSDFTKKDFNDDSCYNPLTCDECWNKAAIINGKPVHECDIEKLRKELPKQ